MHLLSAILATKNENPVYLKKCIDSIVNQSFKDFKLYIVYEDPENNIKLLKTLEQKNSKIIIVKNLKEHGVASARNEGIKNSKSKYIAIVDGDDLHHHNRFNKQITYLENNKKISVLGSNIELIDEDDKIIGKRIYPETHNIIKRQFVYKMPVANPSIIFRREDLLDVGLYDNKFKKAEDYDFWLRFLVNKKKFHNLNDAFVKYRTTEDAYAKRGRTHYINFYKSLSKHSKNIWHFTYRIWFLIAYRIIKNLPNELLRYLINTKVVKYVKSISNS